MPFQYYSGAGDGTPEDEEKVILNSATITVGDAVKLSAGGVEPADAITDRIYGFVTGICDQNGIPLSELVSGTDYDGTYTSATSGDTYVAASDNQTDKKIQAKVVPVRDYTFKGTLDATKGTHTGSDTVGYYLSVLTTDSTQLDESTASGTSEQFLIVGFDTKDAGRPLVKVVEKQTSN